MAGKGRTSGFPAGLNSPPAARAPAAMRGGRDTGPVPEFNRGPRAGEPGADCSGPFRGGFEAMPVDDAALGGMRAARPPRGERRELYLLYRYLYLLYPYEFMLSVRHGANHLLLPGVQPCSRCWECTCL